LHAINATIYAKTAITEMQEKKEAYSLPILQVMPDVR